MEKEVFDDAFKWLQQYHSRQLGKEAKKVYWDKLKHVDDDQFCEAIKKSYDISSPGYFPTINQIANLVGEVRQREWQRQKASEPKELRPPKTTMGREALALMKRLKLHLTPREMAVYMMTDMELKYPDMGWMEEGQKLAQHLENRKKVMEERNAKAEQEKISE